MAEPAKDAVTRSEPAGNVETVRLATPPLIVAEPSVVPFELKVTVPVGRLPLLASVAVNVTLWPFVDGLGEDFSVMVIVA